MKNEKEETRFSNGGLSFIVTGRERVEPPLKWHFGRVSVGSAEFGWIARSPKPKFCRRQINSSSLEGKKREWGKCSEPRQG